MTGEGEGTIAGRKSKWRVVNWPPYYKESTMWGKSPPQAGRTGEGKVNSFLEEEEEEDKQASKKEEVESRTDGLRNPLSPNRGWWFSSGATRLVKTKKTKPSSSSASVGPTMYVPQAARSGPAPAPPCTTDGDVRRWRGCGCPRLGWAHTNNNLRKSEGIFPQFYVFFCNSYEIFVQYLRNFCVPNGR